MALCPAVWGNDAGPSPAAAQASKAAPTTGKAAAEKALTRARKAVAAEPQNARAHVDLAIALGKMTDFTDNRTKMAYAREIRSEAETALRLDPKNFEACLILGKWHDGMTRLNPVLKAIAGTLYGKFPPASVSEAETYLRRAAALAPENLPAHAELASFLEHHGREKEARPEWERVLQLPPQDPEDRAFQLRARAALR
ncbi:MAG TPA: hypothetical protein VF585_02060 [Chthoniobacterales bacterium]